MRHDGGGTELAPCEVVATWPKGSFAENLAVNDAGDIFVSLHTDQLVVRVDPRSGEVVPFARFDRPVTGLAFARDGALIASGGAPGTTPGVVWRVDCSGAVTSLVEIPDATFLNGVLPLGDRMLIAESAAGRIYSVEPVDGEVAIWLSDPLLLAAGDGPGANGLALVGDRLVVSVTGADRLVQAVVRHDCPGKVSVLAEELRADDMAAAVDGSLLIATHPARSLVRLDAEGKRTTLATAEQGMTGATAVAFGRGEDDRDCVYVTATGGTWTLPENEAEVAELVRVRVGVGGAPLLTHR